MSESGVVDLAALLDLEQFKFMALPLARNYTFVSFNLNTTITLSSFVSSALIDIATTSNLWMTLTIFSIW